MITDNLNPDQRIRLESIAQANLTLGAMAGRTPSPEAVLTAAARYETFIRSGTAPAAR